jgi:hypothetical protein
VCVSVWVGGHWGCQAALPHALNGPPAPSAAWSSARPIRNGLLIALKAVDPHDGPARSVASASAAAAAAAASAAVATATASAALATPTASAAVAVPAATAPAVATSPAVAAIPAVGDPGRKDA